MKTETKPVKRPTRRALRAPLAGSPAFISVFVFVLIFGFSNFDFSQDFTDDNYIDDKNISGAQGGDFAKYI